MTLNTELYEAQQGNQECFLKILERFKPTILKFSKELGYEEAQSDLTIALLEFVRKPNRINIKSTSEGAAVNYIYTLLKNKRNDLFRKNRNRLVEVSVLPEILATHPSENKMDENYIIQEALNQLNPKQKNVLTLRYIDGYSDQEISSMMGISRQAVCKTRNLGIQELRKKLN